MQRRPLQRAAAASCSCSRAPSSASPSAPWGSAPSPSPRWPTCWHPSSPFSGSPRRRHTSWPWCWPSASSSSSTWSLARWRPSRGRSRTPSVGRAPRAAVPRLRVGGATGPQPAQRDGQRLPAPRRGATGERARPGARAQGLALLLESAREQGQLEESEHRVLAGAIDLDTMRLTEVMVPLDRAVGVVGSASVLEAQRVSRESGRSRLVVTEGGVPVGIAHVRDIVRAPSDVHRHDAHVGGDAGRAGALAPRRHQRHAG